MINDRKKALRKHYRSLRAELDPEVKACWDSAVTEKLLELPEYSGCKQLLSYVSGGIEVDTRAIMTEALRKKTVFAPRCLPTGGLMSFYRINSFDDLEQGSYGILEPRQDCEIFTGANEALCIVPALSYDLAGHRLGFGGGYYDRFLADFKGVKVGLCYECCLCDELPSDSYDICVDIIVTEKSVLRI